MVDIPRKVSPNIILGALVQMFIFQDGTGGHLGFDPLMNNAGIFFFFNVSRSQINRPSILAREWARNLGPGRNYYACSLIQENAYVRY